MLVAILSPLKLGFILARKRANAPPQRFSLRPRLSQASERRHTCPVNLGIGFIDLCAGPKPGNKGKATQMCIFSQPLRFALISFHSAFRFWTRKEAYLIHAALSSYCCCGF